MTVPTQEAEVVEIRRLCPDVREMVLRPHAHPIPFRPGQWISVHLPLAGERPVIRAYTLAEPPSDGDTLVLCFDRVKEGAVSTWLFDLEVGDRIVVSDALGNFVRPDEVAGLALVTWFTGIVPMRCMLLEMARTGRGVPTVLVYGAPREDQMPYHDQLLELERQNPWLTYVPVCGSGPEKVVEALPSGLARAFPEGVGPGRVHPMIAGIRACVLPAREWFVASHGYQKGQVQKETYD
jgi:ferredoxin-NADP reductase